MASPTTGTSTSPAVQKEIDDAMKSDRFDNATGAREYLEGSVVPVLLQGLTALTRERPENPVDYLGLYLLKRNPNKNCTVEPPKQAQ